MTYYRFFNKFRLSLVTENPGASLLAIGALLTEGLLRSFFGKWHAVSREFEHYGLYILLLSSS
jgi:hypothetical protein